MKKSFSKLREDINIPALGLTYDRDIMPQITDPKAFIEHLRANSISFDRRKVDSNTLKSSQMNFDMKKVYDLLGSSNKDPIITSNDNHVLDGHHRWLSNYYSGKPSDCYVVDLPILELMRVAKEHTSSLNEETTHDDLKPHMDKFVKFVAKKLKIKSVPPIKLVKEFKATSFGGYSPDHEVIHLHTKNRHPMDVFRTLAHELVHHQQREHGKLKDVHEDGKTGSPIEDEANYMAGRIMREWGKKNPNMFSMEALSEAVFVVGVPCSGKDSVIRQLQESKTYKEIDIQTLEKQQHLPENIIVSASANNYDDIVRAKSYLSNQGYMTEMVFVNVPNDISKFRNEQRVSKGQRVINEGVRFAKYEKSIQNIEKFDKLFDGNIVILENCWKGYHQPKKQKLKPKKGSPGQFVPNCVPNKTVKENTNVRSQDTALDKEFAKFVESTAELDTYKRQEGTDSLARLYREATPGQTEESCGCTKGQQNEESCTCSKCQKERKSPVVPDDIGGPNVVKEPLYEKRKIVRKKKLEEDGILDTASGAVGLPVSDSIGAEFGVAKSPSLIGGLTGVASPVAGMGPAGSLYPYGTYGIAESVSRWMNKPETIERFRKKYGTLAEQKLLDTANIINETIEEETDMPKTFKQFREGLGYDDYSNYSAIGSSSVGEKSDEGRKRVDEEKPGLWANIRKRRASGKRMRKKGEKGAPTEAQLRSAQGLDEESAAWQRKEGKNPEGGLNRKGIESYRREHPGSKLSLAVTTEPSKLKKGSKSAKRRLSFCRRMKGMKAKLTSAKTARDPDSRINKSLRKWNCE